MLASITSGGSAEPINFLNKFSINSSTDRVDVTAFGDTNKVYASGLPDAQGDFGGFWDDGTAQLYTASQDGVARPFYWYPDYSVTTKYWFGTGFFDFNLDSGVDKGIEISGSWAAATPLVKVG